jgi:hypothetical protein
MGFKLNLLATFNLKTYIKIAAMQTINLRFLAIDLKTKGAHIPVCQIDNQILVDMRAVSRVLKFAWSTIEMELLTAESFWSVTAAQHEGDTTLLMSAGKLSSWLEQPHGHPSSRNGALTRDALAKIWAYEFPRQVLHIFPESADARSHAAKLARAVRTGKALTDPELAEGIKKTFLTIRQNRKPVERPAHVQAVRIKTMKRASDVSPELIGLVYERFCKTGSFRGLREHFNLTTQALNRIIGGTFPNPTPELLAAHAKAFGKNIDV